MTRGIGNLGHLDKQNVFGYVVRLFIYRTTDLQTVAELCKEKMKRDMAEQELKSIKGI